MIIELVWYITKIIFFQKIFFLLICFLITSHQKNFLIEKYASNHNYKKINFFENETILLVLLVNSTYIYMCSFHLKWVVFVFSWFWIRRPQVRFSVLYFFCSQQKMAIFGDRTDSIFNISYFQKKLWYDFDRSQKNLIFVKNTKTWILVRKFIYIYGSFLQKVMKRGFFQKIRFIWDLSKSYHNSFWK